jgi:hypothetical protein
MEPNIVYLIQNLIERTSFLVKLGVVLFNTDDDALFRLLERSFITITITFTLWSGFYYYENYVHENNEIFRGYDNSHSMFLDQNIWNPLNFNIHQTPWNPLTPIYRKAIDINN